MSGFLGQTFSIETQEAAHTGSGMAVPLMFELGISTHGLNEGWFLFFFFPFLPLLPMAG
jgi:hypothetical protein